MGSKVLENLGKSLQAACQTYGDKLALSSAQGSYSYATLLQNAQTIADQLKDAGMEQDEPVLILVSNQPADLAGILGIWLAGGVIVPVHRTSPEGAQWKIIQKTRARLLLDYQNFSAAPLIKKVSPEVAVEDVMLHGAAFVIFTSGSTGDPKGVVVSHGAFQGKLGEIDRLLNFKPNDRVLLVLNINFVFGLWLALETLLHGGLIHLLEKFDAQEFINTLANEKITRVGVVPTMMRVIFSKPELIHEINTRLQTPILKQILIGGESLGKSLAVTVRSQFTQTELIDIYGSTETASCDFFSFPENFAIFPGSIGCPAGGVSFRIVDQNEDPVNQGVEGELQIYSPYLMSGYLGDPELTQKAFSGKWFKTGDIAREVGASILELMGRSKELISRGGNKVTPGEIEQAICVHANIAAAMAVGIPDAILGERIHVLIVPFAVSEISIVELNEHLKIRLEKFKMPDTFYFASALPTGRTGKADRGQLKQQIMTGLLKPAV